MIFYEIEQLLQLYQKNHFSLSSIHTEAASSIAEADGGREICTVNPRYTFPVASSGRISPQKCRDMRRQPSIYAFSGILPAHISFGITGDYPMYTGPRTDGYSRSFTSPPAPFRMTRIRLGLG